MTQARIHAPLAKSWHRARPQRDWAWERRAQLIRRAASTFAAAVVETAVVAAYLAVYVTVIGPIAEALFLSWPALVVVSGLLLLWRWR